MATEDKKSMKVCDITQCSICLETFKEPKALPCIHTFCVQCLDKHCEDKKQEEVACPLCRIVFKVPHGGIKNLPNNFFIQQLLQVKKSEEDVVLANELELCDICSDAATEIIATSYCVECDQLICDRCSLTHKKIQILMSHKVVPKNELQKSEVRANFSVSYCKQHPGEKSRLYCCDCKRVICNDCIGENHNEHKLADVNKSAEKFHAQLKEDVDKVTACSFRTQKKIEQRKEDIKNFMSRIASTESEITQKCDQVISLIQSHKYQLLKALSEFKSKIQKEVEFELDEIERQFVITESFKRYCQEMMKKGTACDISRTAHDLHDRAEELVKTQDEPDCHELSGVEITFKPFDSRKIDRKNLLGELILRDDAEPTKQDPSKETIDLTTFLNKGKLLHVIPGNYQWVNGITSLGEEVFVVQFEPNVTVYSSNDYSSSYIIAGLSVTEDHNVIIHVTNERVLEYTTRGHFISEIQLDNGLYRRSHIEDPNHNMLVIRQHDVQLYSPTQTHLGDIVIPGREITHPYSLHYDEVKHRLYIGCLSDSEIKYKDKCIFVLGVDIDTVD